MITFAETLTIGQGLMSIKRSFWKQLLVVYVDNIICLESRNIILVLC